jgi:hypothetical protein
MTMTAQPHKAHNNKRKATNRMRSSRALIEKYSLSDCLSVEKAA